MNDEWTDMTGVPVDSAALKVLNEMVEQGFVSNRKTAFKIMQGLSWVPEQSDIETGSDVMNQQLKGQQQIGAFTAYCVALQTLRAEIRGSGNGLEVCVADQDGINTGAVVDGGWMAEETVGVPLDLWFALNVVDPYFEVADGGEAKVRSQLARIRDMIDEVIEVWPNLAVDAEFGALADRWVGICRDARDDVSSKD